MCADVLGMEVSQLRVTPSEIGGGFGGKTVVYVEPLALALSRKACQPVKMVMSGTDGGVGVTPVMVTGNARNRRAFPGEYP